MRRALAISEASFGETHPTVATHLNNLAQLFKHTNRMSEAEPLMRRALAIDEASYGNGHPDVAVDLNNLAQLLTYTNRLSEAEPLMRRALAIDEASYGKYHSTVARDLNNLSSLLQITDRFKEAESMMLRSLKIILQFTQETGWPHPQLANVTLGYLTLLIDLSDSKEQALEKITRLFKQYNAELPPELLDQK
jgi:tetratricopeptide (TPR) repeat protein